MKLQARPKQVRVNTFRLKEEDWVRFQALANRQGWVALGALRQLILQYEANPFPLPTDRVSAGEARTGSFECDASAVAALQVGADTAGITFNDALRELIVLALRKR